MNRVNYNYLKLFMLISCLIIFVFEFAAADVPELFDGAQAVADNLVVLSQSYIVGFIVYLLSAHYPMLHQQRIKAEEQKKMDEIIARRLQKLLTNCMFVIQAASNYKMSQRDIWAQPLNQKTFSEATEMVFHKHNVAQARTIKPAGDPVGRLMTVGENVQDSLTSIEASIDSLLKLEKHLDLDLFNTILDIEECSLMISWSNRIDDRPDIIGGKVFQTVPTPIGKISKIFVEFDESYRELILLMEKYDKTEAYNKFDKHMRALEVRI